DGVFSLIRTLFSDCTDREEALSTARENQDLLQREAERILRENGSREEVTVEVGSRFFPTKSYGALSFPAGNYQAVSICIGEAKGRNFWCVLYPALCLAPAVAEDDAAEELVAAVGKQETEFLKKSTQKQQIKFFLVEWFEQITEKFIKR
ncbi:MAG: stage II sporulation protein R, partial [Clostridia bacterium]|nr:stage II sporulation protein R [Clostridia bacterium]